MDESPNAVARTQQDAERESQIDQLRHDYYNATLIHKRLAHEKLMIIRIKPDEGFQPFKPGQYLTLGLGSWETRIDQLPPEAGEPQMIRRAYSVSCTMFDEGGQLVGCNDCDYLEFYITLVDRADEAKNCPLTPRLFALEEGGRLHAKTKFVGTYNLDPVEPEQRVIFAATGTGEAPHNAMAVELLANGHREPIISLTCVRYREDAAYLAEQERLMAKYPNYRYEVLTTREPENVDADHPGFVGKKYIQDLFQEGRFEARFGWQPTAETTHIFMCGNPDMIGLPRKGDDGELVYPTPMGMARLLTEQGHKLDAPRRPGNVHFEKYW